MPGRILLADRDGNNRTLLRLKLNAASYVVSETKDLNGLITKAKLEHPDIIILSDTLSDVDGYQACSQLKSDAKMREIPAIMVLDHEELGNPVRALECGADDILHHPIDELILLARIRSLRKSSGSMNELQLRAATSHALGFAETRSNFAHPGRIGLIARSPDQAQTWKTDLSKALGGCIFNYSSGDILTITGADPCPDVFVISGDLTRPDEGLRLLSELRSSAQTRHAGIIMVLRPGAQQQAVLALDIGVSDLLYEGFSSRELALRVKAQIRQKQRADCLRKHMDEELKLVSVDPLTGLYNRRYAFAHLKRISDHAVQSERTFAIMMLDIDKFKSVNDQFGHAIGDRVLKEVANRLQGHLRAGDLLARIGGEEFLTILPDTSLKEAQFVSERLRHAIDCTPFKTNPTQTNLNITISAGVSLGGDETDVNTLLLQADRALYLSKNSGRNRVSFAAVEN